VLKGCINVLTALIWEIGWYFRNWTCLFLEDKLSYLKSTWIFFEIFATGHQLSCLTFEDKSTKRRQVKKIGCNNMKILTQEHHSSIFGINLTLFCVPILLFKLFFWISKKNLLWFSLSNQNLANLSQLWKMKPSCKNFIVKDD
jgi:hypothetical protein